MANQETFLTPEGHQKLEEELDFLTTVRRSEVAAAIHEAKMDGDVSENAGYEEAKRQQAFVEGRIMTIQAMLESAVLYRGFSWQQELHWKEIIDLKNERVTTLMGNLVQVGYFFHHLWEKLVLGFCKRIPVGFDHLVIGTHYYRFDIRECIQSPISFIASESTLFHSPER